MKTTGCSKIVLSVYCLTGFMNNISVNIGSGNIFLSDSTETLPEPMLTYHQKVFSVT